jgi:DNA polymerase elongation subunit (family B)
METTSTPPAGGSASLLFGTDPLTRIVGVEPTGTDRVRVYRRGDEGVSVDEDPFRPWLLAARAEPWAAVRPRPEISPLAGSHPLRFLIEFPSWPAFSDASRAARDAGETLFRLRSPVEQYLVRSGRTLFKGMVFEDLRRLQLDIETLGFDPRQPEARVILVALRCSDGTEELLALESTEADLLRRLNDRIAALDPDVLEGHNVFNFDLPFLVARAERAGVALLWGRDGSPVRIGQGQARFKAGALTLPFTPVYVSGRHVVDTYQQIQRYDTGGRLGSYGLKNAVEELGLTRADREFVPGEQIRDLWATDRPRLLRYALDDVRDVDTLSRLVTPTEFYQTQLLPRSFQAVATGGPGEKINDLMLRAYLMQGHSLPTAQAARDYPGGHAELLAVGAFAPVVKCDVESLYPSIMLAEGITAGGDALGAYLPMLRELTRRRLEAKAMSRATLEAGREAERGMWEGLQGSFKVLINSFYGYLGYGGALFNDYDAAERVTLAGQRIVKRVVERLEATGATPIEVDTDGVYFVPPPHVRTETEEHAYVEEVATALPSGIRLAHDGRYAGMLSLKLKTYALLGHDEVMLLKGSALRSRRMEPCFRGFLRDAAFHFLRQEREVVRDAYFQLGERIRRRELRSSEFVQWAMLNEETLAKHPKLQRLVARGTTGGPSARSGDRLEVYEREDGELGLVSEYAADENVAYLLRRLRDVAARFRALFDSDAAFDAFFPPLSMRTDLAAARDQQASQQLNLFG